MKKQIRFIPLAVVLLFLIFSSTVSAALVGGSSKLYSKKITSNVTTISVINTSGFFYFIPTASQSYTIYSGNSTVDFGVFLYDSDDNTLTSNNDAGLSTEEFSITYDLIAGSKYYLRIHIFDGSGQGTCDMAILGPISTENPITVSDQFIFIDGATGISNTFKIGDTVTVTWHIGHAADDNPDVNQVAIDFSQFGGTLLTAKKVHTSWVASYTITEGIIDNINRNVSVYALNTSGFSKTGWDGTNATVDNEPPVVTAANISISGASGTGGTFIVGDTITATWDNTSSGDNNDDDISSVTADFSEFGGGSAVSASNSSDTWSATFIITSGSINSANLNISITATDDAGNNTKTEDDTDASVNNQSPSVTASNISLSGASGTGGTFITGDTITATWDNTSSGDNNSDISSVIVDFSEFGGGSAVSTSNTSETYTATYTLTSGSLDSTNLNISITATDGTGYNTTTDDDTDASADNQSPSVTASYISISGATGTSGTFIVGDTITATWDNTSSGDNNSDISSVTVDFSEFGGGSAVSTSTTSETYTTTYTLTSGSLDSINLNISITATDDAGNSTTTEDDTDASADNQAPSVTDSNISLSGATGTGGTFIAGDTVTATWNNTSSGDNNGDIVSASFNFGEFGGGSSVSASENAGIWTAEHTIIEDTVNDTNCNVSLTATDDVAQTSTASDSTDAKVDSTKPTVVLTDNEGDNIVKGGDTVVITATFSEPMSSSPQISIADGGVSSESMTNSGNSITWTYLWTVPISDTSAIVSVNAADTAGNIYSGSDEIEFLIDSTAPVISGVSNNGVYVERLNISFSEGVAFLNGKHFSSGSSVYKIGDYSLEVTDQTGNITSINFSIRLEKTVVTSNRLSYQLIDIERETDDGKTKVFLNVNSEVLDLILNSRFEDKDIRVEVFENSKDKSVRSFYLCMTLADIELMIDKGSIITLETPLGRLIIDPRLINMDRLTESFGEISSDEIRVELSIVPSHYYRTFAINRLADISGRKVITNPITFDMRCSYNDKTVVSVNFTESLEMWIPIDEADALTDLSAVRLMPDMTLERSEVEVISENGDYYAKFTSTMNGTFAIVEIQ